MGLNELMSMASRSGGAPSAREASFRPKWPLKPSAKVPRHDPTQSTDDTNPSNDKTQSGGETSGIHGRGRGAEAEDTGVPSKQDITVPPAKKNKHHCDDDSQPEESSRKDFDKRKGVRGLRSRKRRQASAEPDETEPTPPAPASNATFHTATGIRMNAFSDTTDGPRSNLPGTTPLRKVTPSKRTTPGQGTARSRKLPGKAAKTGKLPCPGCQPPATS